LKQEIKSRVNGNVLFSGDYGSIKECVVAAVKSGANLSGADLSRAKNVDAYFQFGPVGSRHVILVYNATKKIFQTGCFSGTEAELLKAVKEKHAKTKHLNPYLLAIKSLKALAKL
jgi:2-keto-3-deoxy-6-phosphogluconate aldolase